MRLNIPIERRDEEARHSRDRRLEFENRIDFPAFAKRLRAWDTQWRGLMRRMNKPWDHATDYNPLMTFSKVEDMHAVLFGFVSELTFFRVAASSRGELPPEIMQQRSDRLTELLRWSLLNESNGIAFLDQFIHDGIMLGVGFGEVSWLRDTRNIQAEIFIPPELARSEERNDVRLIKQLMSERLQSKTLREVGKGKYQADFIDEDGEKKSGLFWIDRENPNREEGVLSLIVQREWSFHNAPFLRNIAPWDIIVPSDTIGLQQAKRYWVRRFFGIEELAANYRSGLFNAMTRDDLEELRIMAKSGEKTGKVPNVSDVSAQSTSGHDIVEAARDASLRSGKLESRKDRFEVFFEYAFEDVDGDGVAESIVRAMVEGHGKPRLLMRQRIEYLYPHGRRPHFDWHFLPAGHRYYGIGIPEILETSQVEENAFYQARSDVLEIITKPGGMYDPMSGLAPDEIRYAPGMMVKARLADGPAFQPFAFASDPSLLFREQSGIELMAERAIGQTDMGMGRSPNRPNAPRTLGGTAIVVRQQQLRTNVYLTRLLVGQGSHPSGMSELFRQYMELYACFIPENKEFRATGTNEVHAISRSDLQGRYDFVIDVGEDMNNPQLRLQNSLLVYDRSLANPLVMNNEQALWHVTTRMWEASGIRNARKILPPPDPQTNRPPMDPETILDALSKGIRLKPLPGEDHNAMLAAITDLLGDQRRIAEWPSEAIPLLEQYAQQTMQFAMAAQSSAMQQRGQLGSANSIGGQIVSQEQVATPIGGIGGDLNL